MPSGEQTPYLNINNTRRPHQFNNLRTTATMAHHHHHRPARYEQDQIDSDEAMAARLQAEEDSGYSQERPASNLGAQSQGQGQYQSGAYHQYQSGPPQGYRGGPPQGGPQGYSQGPPQHGYGGGPPQYQHQVRIAMVTGSPAS